MNKLIKIILIGLAILLTAFFAVFYYFFIGSTAISENITWGVDFSQSQAEYLKLDWKQAYSAIIDDLGAKNIKLHTNWNLVEIKPGEFYFDDIDWQIKEAEQKNVKVIYVLGMKTGRWPECHIPDWAQNLAETQQQEELLKYATKVVERYKDSKAIDFWQVENEPLFKFGECPEWYYKNKNFLKAEVDLVKSLDSSRKIIISDSGEFSSWFPAAKIGDLVGTTMYRDGWAHISNTFGFYFHYFFSPVFYSRKALLIKKFFGKNVICIELQAEPWAPMPFYKVPLKDQYKTMDLKRFKDNIEYAKKTGFDAFYLWGVEWWYWLKTEQNQPEIWNEAKSLFK